MSFLGLGVATCSVLMFYWSTCKKWLIYIPKRYVLEECGNTFSCNGRSNAKNIEGMGENTE